MSQVLDYNRSARKAVHADLLRVRRADAKRGRKGMTAEQVVRAAIVKQMFGLSYEELPFRIGDSLQLRAFCRFSPADQSPKKSALQANVERGAIRPESWESLNKTLVKDARDRKQNESWAARASDALEATWHRRAKVEAAATSADLGCAEEAGA